MKRSDTLLLLIESYCFQDGRYWVAQATPQYLSTTKEWISVSGAGDAKALKSLVDRGLIVRMPLTGASYRITEEGKLKAQELA